MSRRAASLLAIATIACGGRPSGQPLYGAGTNKDDGHGLLGRASARLLTRADAEPSLFPTAAARGAQNKLRDIDHGEGGDADGRYGGTEYGGASYATYVVPPWSYPNVNRTVRYTQRTGLTAAIEGVITWRGAPPPPLTTSCGVVEPLRVAADRGVGGLVVYIEHVSVGRTLPHDGGERRPSNVGGVITKRGCALVPTVQVVTPLPAAITIHGDARRARLVIMAPASAAPKPLELQEAGRIELQARPGVTHVVSDDGSIGAAWVIGLDTPSYAITDDTGRYRIDELAPGTYDVTIWQPPLATVTNGKLAYDAPVVMHRTIKIESRTTRLDVALGR